MKPNGNDNSIAEFRKFINTLRCPLCQSQLDGNIHPMQSTIYCVSNNNEYYGIWTPTNTIPEYEVIKHYYPQYEYQIMMGKIYNNGGYQTQILRYNRDVASIYRESTSKILFDINGRILIFRERIEEKDLLKKIKLYNVFS